jgi:hypothetical protein
VAQKRIRPFSNLDEARWDFEVRKDPPIELQQALRTITPSQMLTQIPPCGIRLPKLDIQGAERELFMESADKWLPKDDAIVFEFKYRFNTDIPTLSMRLFTSVNFIKN